MRWDEFTTDKLYFQENIFPIQKIEEEPATSDISCTKDDRTGRLTGTFSHPLGYTSEQKLIHVRKSYHLLRQINRYRI
jgi:hypothetical protein